MLTLGRRAGESLVLIWGDEVVEITLRVNPRGQIKLAINAPRAVQILRKELLLREAAHREEDGRDQCSDLPRREAG